MKKKIFIIVVIIIAIGFIVLVVSRFVTSSPSGSNSVAANGSGGLLTAPPSLQKDPNVARDFLNQASDVSQVTLGGAAVAGSYAVQIWSNDNGGGQALLEQSPSGTWTLLSLGGGAMNLFSLLEEGVPFATAEQLVVDLGSGTPTATSTISIPSGDTITIGTSVGSVTTRNFYKSAVYISSEENSVVVAQSSTYSVVYDISRSRFSIHLLSLPFASARQSAETAFLAILGISEQDACKLSVLESASGLAESQYAGQSFPLSFCSVAP